MSATASMTGTGGSRSCYRDQVVPATLDMIGLPDQTLLLEGGQLRTKLEVEKDLRRSLMGFERNRAIAALPQVEMLDPTSFGTAEEIQRDRLFLARANYADQIGALAEQEFERRKNEVRDWLRTRMLANLPRIQDILVQPQVWVKTKATGRSFEDRVYGVRYDVERGKREFINRQPVAEIKDYIYSYLEGNGGIVAGREPWKAGVPACQFTGGPAVELVQIVPETTEQLAWLCGVEVGDLPDVLQHWNRLHADAGNHLLDRVDPLLWKVSDPWAKQSYCLNVYLSKRALASLAKQAASRAFRPPPFAA